MQRSTPLVSLSLLAIVLVALTITNERIHRLYASPYPRMQELVVSDYGLQDIGFILNGCRSAAADMAWVQLLQYVGGEEEQARQIFPQLQALALRVVRIDPYFRRAYLLSAGILAWFRNVNRPDEAVEVLNEGIRQNPTYWPLRTYLVAIGYKRSDQFQKMAESLEQAIQHPECPLLIKAILANSYKAQKQYRRAIEIWFSILDDPASQPYHDKARIEIPIIYKLMGSPNESRSVAKKK